MPFAVKNLQISAVSRYLKLNDLALTQPTIVCRLFTAVIAGKKAFAGNAQGIEAEIPEALGTKAEELERKARFFAACRKKCAQIISL